jgi:adenine-specific DNA-methyltransferase
MNYIGSKNKLSNFIKAEIKKVVGETKEKIFCDLFAGTGCIGRVFKLDTKKIIANDAEYYSFVLNRNYIGNHHKIDFHDYLNELNYLNGIDGFIFKHYCAGSGSGRQYFSDDNGRKIDAVRQKIENWKTAKYITDDIYFFLLASLLEHADAVANTASVYGAFLKSIKKSALKELWIKPALFEINHSDHEIYNKDANELINEKGIEGDILYLDPPYNARQYGSNYHLLNTIALYDNFQPSGKTGLREYKRSLWCQKGNVQETFNDLIKNAKFKYIFLSYNNEGLMPPETIQKVMSDYGRYDVIETAYQRFKADTTENRNHKASETIEYLHLLEKS